MATNTQRSVIPGTQRNAIENAQVIGPVPENQRIEVTILLRSENDRSALHAQTMAIDQPISKRQILSRQEFAQK